MAKPGITAKKAWVRINQEAEKACDEWQALVDDDPTTPVYLYWYPPNKRQRLGRVKAARKRPRVGWRLVANMIMSPRWSHELAMTFIVQRMLLLPILRGPIKS